MLARSHPRGVGVAAGSAKASATCSPMPELQAIANDSSRRLSRAARAIPALEAARRNQGSRETPLGARLIEYINIFEFGNPPSYDPCPEPRPDRASARAKARHLRTGSDRMLKDGGTAALVTVRQLCRTQPRRVASI